MTSMKEIMDRIESNKPVCHFCGGVYKFDKDTHKLLPCCNEKADQRKKEKEEAEQKEQEKKRKQQELQNNSQYKRICTKRYLDANIDDFRELIKKDAELKKFVVDIDKNKKCNESLLMFGNPGTGKTHLSFALARYIINKCNMSGLVRKKFYELKSIYFEDMERFNDIVECNLLIIDDLGIGVSKNVEWEQEVLTRIIDYRYESMLPSIFTTNYELDQLKDYIGSRNTDRLKECFLVYELKGKSRRGK